MLSEINDMPVKAKEFLAKSPAYTLPEAVPYIGMGSSYFAPLAFKYMGIDIYPEIASEYFSYLHKEVRVPDGVLLSQSGKSTEVLWCASLFDNFTAISNDSDSPLCTFHTATTVISLLAGEEKYSSSKTYINTLLALFKGFGFDTTNAVRLLTNNMALYEKQGKEIAASIFTLLQHRKLTGIYITGSGPNIATAMQAALIMSESTKLNFTGIPMSQYDHGPKETAKDSIVINVLSKGKAGQRTEKLADTIREAGATVFTIQEKEAVENESILHNIIPFNYMAYYLSKLLRVEEIFRVGGKVTEVI